MLGIHTQIEELFEESELSSESARFIIDGSAYYDIEDDSGKWLRILCEYGDLLILPAGRLHRFTTTPKVIFHSPPSTKM